MKYNQDLSPLEIAYFSAGVFETIAEHRAGDAAMQRALNATLEHNDGELGFIDACLTHAETALLWEIPDTFGGVWVYDVCAPIGAKVAALLINGDVTGIAHINDTAREMVRELCTDNPLPKLEG